MEEKIVSGNKSYIELNYSSLCALIVEFIVCGFVGWIYETVLTSYMWGHFADRGFLHIPVLPIYGIFAFLMLPVFRKRNKFYQVFLISFFAATFFELMSAYLIEAVLHQSLWDYSNWDFNFFGGRISLYSSIIFGLLSVFLVKAVHPGCVKLTTWMSENSLKATGTICWIVFLTDTVISLAGR